MHFLQPEILLNVYFCILVGMSYVAVG
jgi:hypothetical protein